MDRGAWQAIVCRVAKSRTQLKRLSTHISTDGVNFNSGSGKQEVVQRFLSICVGI